MTSAHNRTFGWKLLALIALCVWPGAAAADDDDTVVPGQVVLRLTPGASIDTIVARYGVEWGTTLLDSIASRRTYLVGVFEGDEEEFVDILEHESLVERAEPNYTGKDTNPDPGTQSIFVARHLAEYIGQPSMVIIGADGAHAYSTGEGVVVAVIDSGIDPEHPQLAPRIVPGGWNFVAENSDIRDRREGVDSNGDGVLDGAFGHGTLVAGLVARVAPGAGLLPLKVMDSDGLSNTFTMVEAIYYAMDQGVTVINLSMGTTQDVFVIEDAVREAAARGVVIVASVGNEDTSSPVRFPAGHSALGVVAVAATDNADLKAEFSNYGPFVSISAPGDGVTSTVPDGGYGEVRGTSFSAPMVSAAFAMLRAVHPDAPPHRLHARLDRSAVNLDPLNGNYAGELGSGRMSLLSALADGGLGGGAAGSRRTPNEVWRQRRP